MANDSAAVRIQILGGGAGAIAEEAAAAYARPSPDQVHVATGELRRVEATGELAVGDVPLVIPDSLEPEVRATLVARAAQLATTGACVRAVGTPLPRFPGEDAGAHPGIILGGLWAVHQDE